MVAGQGGGFVAMNYLTTCLTRCYYCSSFGAQTVPTCDVGASLFASRKGYYMIFARIFIFGSYSIWQADQSTLTVILLSSGIPF